MDSKNASERDVGKDLGPQEPSSSRWDLLRGVIWDGPRTKEEHRLVRRLDFFVL